MLEAVNYDSLEQMSPFSGANADVMCGYENEPEISKLSTQYVELSNSLRRDIKALE